MAGLTGWWWACGMGGMARRLGPVEVAGRLLRRPAPAAGGEDRVRHGGRPTPTPWPPLAAALDGRMPGVDTCPHCWRVPCRRRRPGDGRQTPGAQLVSRRLSARSSPEEGRGGDLLDVGGAGRLARRRGENRHRHDAHRRAATPPAVTEMAAGDPGLACVSPNGPCRSRGQAQCPVGTPRRSASTAQSRGRSPASMAGPTRRARRRGMRAMVAMSGNSFGDAR